MAIDGPYQVRSRRRPARSAAGERLGAVVRAERVGLVGQQDQVRAEVHERPRLDLRIALRTVGEELISPSRRTRSPPNVGTPTTIHGSRQMGTTTPGRWELGGRPHSASASRSHSGSSTPSTSTNSRRKRPEGLGRPIR